MICVKFKATFTWIQANAQHLLEITGKTNSLTKLRGGKTKHMMICCYGDVALFIKTD